jgi:hypothetical protein
MIRKAVRVLAVLLALGAVAVGLTVAWLVRGYPRGSGGAVVSPDERHEAVLLDLTDRNARGVLRGLFDRHPFDVPEERRLRLEIVRGRFGSDEDELVASLDLPEEPPPPGKGPRDWIRWNEDGKSAVFLLTRTNLVLHTAEWTP